MRRVQKFGVATALSVGLIGTMLATAPAAIAATPVPVNSTSALQDASPVAPRLADGDYRKGYRDGYRDGFADGKVACNKHGAKKGNSNRDNGYADGYRAGFAAGDELCRD